MKNKLPSFVNGIFLSKSGYLYLLVTKKHLGEFSIDIKKDIEEAVFNDPTISNVVKFKTIGEVRKNLIGLCKILNLKVHPYYINRLNNSDRNENQIDFNIKKLYKTWKGYV